MDSIISLYNILKQDIFDEEGFNKFIKTKGTRGFLEHQKNIDGRLNIEEIRDEVKRVVLYENYKDKYEFYLIKEDIEKLYKDIYYIQKNEEQIIAQALHRVYKIVPKDMIVSSNIYLYGGGMDGGFTINRKKVFINYGKYIGHREEFIKVLSHELYHSRNFSIKSRFIFFLKMFLNTNRLTYEVIGKSLEEGIACLVQHDAILKTDDPVGTLTKRNLILLKEEFDRLNDILLKIKSGKGTHRDIKTLNIYAIGYHIVSTIYNAEGVLPLDDWTLNLEYARIVEIYIETCNSCNIPSGFTKEIEEWIVCEKGEFL